MKVWYPVGEHLPSAGARQSPIQVCQADEIKGKK